MGFTSTTVSNGIEYYLLHEAFSFARPSSLRNDPNKMADFEDEFEESDSGLSDDELQKDFASGKLKAGLNIKLHPQSARVPHNNVAGMKQKLEQISQNLDWIERMDITVESQQIEEGGTLKTTAAPTPNSEKSIHDDFQREMRFYKQAQVAMRKGLNKLKQLGIPSKRPEDYFAEMLKTDDHMQRVRGRLLSKQQAMERSEKAKKQREMKKFGKKVQREVLQKRQQEKKAMMEAVKGMKKEGKHSAHPDLAGDKDEFQIQTERGSSSIMQGKVVKRGRSAKRKGKDAKFGLGGKKSGMKRNTTQSFSDVSSFNSAKHSKMPRAKAGKMGKKRKNVRPGKSRRKRMKK
ncbi:probable rRNA-processing protein EBP2 [Montipora foliosa]|uniref:probable rRNA-processing protein EBP2 n=1 Tax=Montipora foliosa TaxID=591990 RepID=UPI0035F13854